MPALAATIRPMPLSVAAVVSASRAINRCALDSAQNALPFDVPLATVKTKIPNKSTQRRRDPLSRNSVTDHVAPR